MSDEHTSGSLQGRNHAAARPVDPALQAAIQRLAEKIESLEKRVLLIDSPVPRRRGFAHSTTRRIIYR